MTEILRNKPIKTFADAGIMMDFLRGYQGDDTLLITNWIYLGRKHPDIEESTHEH